VSGKKDDLVDRIMQHYRTEIPTTEDGTTELLDDFEQVPEVPPAPDLVEMSQADDEVEQSPEVVQESQPDFREILPETPIFVSEQDGQLYAYDPPRVVDKKTGRRTNRLRRSLNNLFAVMLFIFTLSVIDVGFDMGIFDKFGILNEILANRVIPPYGGMSDTMTVALSASVAIIFFAATLMLLSGRRPATAGMLVMTAVTLSFAIRGGAAIVAGSFDDLTVVGHLIIDLMLAIPFTVTFWIPAMLQLLLPSDETEPTSGFFAEPESITDTSDDGNLGEDMGDFSVARPKPPKRRQPGSYSLYEIIFLILSAVLWPISLGMLILLSLPNFETRYGGISAYSTAGTTLLGIFFFLAITCSYFVFKYDREARDGAEYAKEKLAYHRDMDQFLDLKKAYYEKKAEELGTSSSTGEES
jgi:hypothetical protein